MAKEKIILELARNALRKTVPTDFSGTVQDVETALRGELKELLGTSRYTYEQNKWTAFALIAEAISEILPNVAIQYMGRFAEIRRYADGDKPIFTVKHGRMRAKQFVTQVSPAGTYECFRLDRSTFEVPIQAWGTASSIDFERYLSGLEDLAEVFSIVMEELQMILYRVIQEELLATWNHAGRPQANQLTMGSFDADEMISICRTVAAYGSSAVILCSAEFASKMHNSIDFATRNPNTPEADLMDIRNMGYIGTFRGFSVNIIPNSFEDDTNTKLEINPKIAYVLPVGRDTRPIRVAFEGQLQIDEFQNKGDRSREIQAYQKMGAAVVLPLNAWGMVQNTEIVSEGWNDLV